MDANVIAGFRKFGMSESDIEALQEKDRVAVAAAKEAAIYDVYEDNWESWLFFLEVDTQWLYVSLQQGWRMVARRIGMNYSGVQAGAQMSGRPRRSWPALFADLRVIEAAILKADAEQQQQ